jgi:hypothetical protein
MLRRATGDLPGALADHEAARAIRQELADRDPGNVPYRGDLASSQNNIGASFAIQPRFLQGRMGMATPMAVPLAGLYGIE